MTILERAFFARPTLTVARTLLGQRLVREIEGQRLSGLIVETEAYIGPTDTASHASKGRTARTEVMFGPAGYTYVYFIYGMYYMFNLTTEELDFPAAVLVRALQPEEGVGLMQARRQKPGRPPLKITALLNGPGKLCQALDIDRRLDRWDVTLGQALWLEPGEVVAEAEVATGPRLGIDYAAPEDRLALWRFWLKGNRFVSGRTQ
jgi:DNA-3-methyladenine glycosylase